MHPEIQFYHSSLENSEQKICEFLEHTINSVLKKQESKIWHAHPVWFIDENPIVGYSKQKKGIRLMFWSGADFEEAAEFADGASVEASAAASVMAPS
ncbi:MAG TPA: hypothetical protein PK610_05835, partial [Flavobacteriales bacterium]|nr:hypothetical protein [Flavobacteriales bacterium]